MSLENPRDPNRIHLNPELYARFAAYHAEHPSWGVLHIVLDDGNNRDSEVAWTVEYARECDDQEGLALAEILAELTRTQRFRISDRV